MIAEIEVAVDTVKVIRHTTTVDMPERNTFYSKVLGAGNQPTLFGIYLRFKKPGKYFLVKVEANRQEFTDFHVGDDVKSEHFIKNSLRQEALNLMCPNSFARRFDYVEITEIEFKAKRMDLLKLPENED